MNFMNSKGLRLQSVTLPAAPRGAQGKVGHGQGARWRCIRKERGESESGLLENFKTAAADCWVVKLAWFSHCAT